MHFSSLAITNQCPAMQIYANNSVLCFLDQNFTFPEDFQTEIVFLLVQEA
jgi:hypothetical protein